MLLALTLRDFAIVEQLALEFDAGFTALTGETGAGKSILIDALQFALGERASADIVREGCARAEVTAEFLPDAAALQWLAQAGLEDDADAAGEVRLLVRRSVDAAGRSRGFINGRPATLAQLREIGERVLDVHGQHEHQSLLRASAQGELLDRHAGLGEQVAAVALAYARWRAACQSLEQSQAMQADADERSRVLRELLDDLEPLAPQEGEWDSLGAEQKRLAHGAALIDGARSALDVLAEAPDAVQPRLAKLSSRLGQLCGYDARLEAAVTALAGADIQLEEAARALNQYLGDLEVDGGRLEQVEARLAALHAAGRKWRCAPAQLAARLREVREELERLASAGDLEALREAQVQAHAGFLHAAGALGAARREGAQAMAAAVSRVMQDLAMSGARLEVLLTPCDANARGLERVEFLIGAHSGGAARPLARIASGGELSRIGLAIAVVAASANPVPTLIFDEVDTGVGGQVAATVGMLLQRLGRSRQVLCVTHLPQVAACADQQLAVRKATHADGRPASHTVPLDQPRRIEEIARMLGGAHITETTRRHAAEMLEAAHPAQPLARAGRA